jgi:hypothetical protein
MNKFIFQIGVLGFCVAAVVYGGSGASILDIVSRSFIVFVGIILAAATIIMVGGTMIENNKARENAGKSAVADAQRKQ